MRLLEAVGSGNGEISAEAIFERASLPASTGARLLNSLIAEGLVERRGRGRYELGMRFIAIAQNAVSGNDLVLSAQVAMSRLRDETGETVSLHILQGDQRVCVAEARSRHAISRVLPPGTVMPLLDTATGNALLSQLGGAQRDERLARLGLDHAGLVELAARLDRVAAAGWDLVVDSWTHGVSSLSIPVVAEGNLAALTVSGPSDRFTEAVAMTWIETARTTAASIGANRPRRLAGEIRTTMD